MLTLCQRWHFQSELCKHRNSPHSRGCEAQAPVTWHVHSTPPWCSWICTYLSFCISVWPSGLLRGVKKWVLLIWLSWQFNHNLCPGCHDYGPGKISHETELSKTELSQEKNTLGMIHTLFTYCYNAQAQFQYPLTHLGRTPVVWVWTGAKFNYVKIQHTMVVLAEMMINEDSKITAQALVVNRKGMLWFCKWKEILSFHLPNSNVFMEVTAPY